MNVVVDFFSSSQVWKTLIKGQTRTWKFFLGFDARERVFSSSKEVAEPLGSRVAEANELDGAAVPRGRGIAAVAGSLAAAHLVHPRAAVQRVPAEDKT